MSFKTVSAILRGQWLLDKNWAQSHIPVLISVLNGKGSFAGMFEPDEQKQSGNTEPVKVLSHKTASVYAVNYFTDLSRLPSGSIAMMDITGPVTKYGDVCAWGMIDHVATLNRLVNSANVSGIILNIDSPGGEASGTGMFAQTIKQATRSKPVIALIDDGIAASAAMWIASAASEIYTTQKTDMVGSVGVYTTIADWYGYMESQGLKVRDIYAPQSTEKNLDYREALTGNDGPIKEELKVLAQEFIDTVSANRAGKINGDEWKTGRMFYSKEAKKIGLIDGQKSFSQVVKRMNEMITTKQQTSNNNHMENNYEKVSALVPEGEQFDASSFENGAAWITESHLANIEVELKNNADAITAKQDAITTKETELATANETIEGLNNRIETQATEIKMMQDVIEDLRKKPAADFKNTIKEKDEHGSADLVEESEATKENKRRRQQLGMPVNF